MITCINGITNVTEIPCITKMIYITAITCNNDITNITEITYITNVIDITGTTPLLISPILLKLLF